MIIGKNIGPQNQFFTSNTSIEFIYTPRNGVPINIACKYAYGVYSMKDQVCGNYFTDNFFLAVYGKNNVSLQLNPIKPIHFTLYCNISEGSSCAVGPALRRGVEPRNIFCASESRETAQPWRRR